MNQPEKPGRPQGAALHFGNLVTDYVAFGLTLLFMLDRLLKLLATWHFFRRPLLSDPPAWPDVSLVQPITRGASNLSEALQARARLDYPAAIQHVLICDTTDEASQAIVTSFLAEFPALQTKVILVQPEKGRAVASKIEKLQAALPHATGHVLCFIDDDVSVRPHSLKVLVPYLFEPEVGVAFGLPCFSNWQTVWSSLISGLINAHMVPSFVALTYLTNPFRINGHIFAFRRETFQQMGGFDGLEQQIDDEYEIAKRVRIHGLRAMQTPLIYDIDNALPTRRAYTRQFKRWFVMPRQAMMPSLTASQRRIAGLSSLTLPIPSILALLALLTRRRSTLVALTTTLTLFSIAYALCEKRYLQRRTPLHGWLLLPVVAICLPLQILWTLLLNNEVDWRGQRLRLLRNGKVEVMS